MSETRSDKTRSPHHADHPVAPEAVVARRGLIRAGALAAAATAGAVAATATSATKANAANGDAVTVGGSFTGDAPTQLAISGSATLSALKLTNDTGPSLLLTKTTRDLTSDLPGGGLAFTPSGLTVGLLDDDNQAFTTGVATYNDLASLPLTAPLSPTRLLDTRSASGRDLIVSSSSGAFDSSGRLKAGAYLDLGVAGSGEDITFLGAFLNVTVTQTLGGGFVFAYVPGNRSAGSTVNFVKGQTIANGTFVALGVVQQTFAVRFYTNATTHLIVDLNGAVVSNVPGPDAPAAAVKASRTRTARTRPSARINQTLGAARRRS